jgi:mRNA interferase MazF
MKHGDLVRAALPGAYGKPRPAMIIQADTIAQPNSLTVLPLTDEITSDETLRVTIEASCREWFVVAVTGYDQLDHHDSFERIGRQIGHLSTEDMAAVRSALAHFLGFA